MAPAVNTPKPTWPTMFSVLYVLSWASSTPMTSSLPFTEATMAITSMPRPRASAGTPMAR